MKKTSLILVLAIILTTLYMPNIEATSVHDPYKGLEMIQFDKIVNGTSSTTADDRGFVRNVTAGQFILLKDVDFGAEGTTGVEVYAASAGTDSGGQVAVRLDDPKSDPVAVVTTSDSGWATPATLYTDLEQKITGVHDVYVNNIKKMSNIFKLVFVKNDVGSSGALSYEGDTAFTDIEDNPYKYSIYTLWNLGIIKGFSDGLYEPQIGVSRADFANILFSILDNSEYTAGEQIFTDVTQGDGAFNAVSYLRERSVISMPEDKMFNPHSFIKTIDAAVMVVRALGYEEIAKLRGGYPMGYLAIATEEGILRGLDVDEYLCRDTMAGLIENMLNADYLDIRSVSSSGTIDYEKTAGILEMTRGIKKGKGTVTQNSTTGLKIPGTSLEEGQVAIDGKTYLVGETAAALLLGYEVNFFYNEDEETNERNIICIRPRNGLDVNVYDTAVDIESMDIDENELSYAKKDGTEKTVSFDDSTQFIYNGVAIDAPLSQLTGGGEFRGKITHIRNSGNDVVVIEQYRNVVVQSVDTSKLIVRDELSGESFNFNSEDGKVIIIKDKKASSMRLINVGTILTVYASKNTSGKKYIKAIIEENSVSGKVTRVQKDTVTIGDKKYRISLQCQDTISLGMTGKFMLNSFDEIVSYIFSPSEGTQAGILIAYATEDNGIDDSVKIKVFDKAGKTQIIPCRKTVVLDGVSRKTAAEVVNGKGVYGGLEDISMNTLVRYTVNADGEVTVLDTYAKGNESTNDTLTRLSAGVENVNFIIDNSMIVQSDGKGAYPYENQPEFFIFWTANDEDTLEYQPKFPIGGDIEDSTQFDGDIYTLDVKNPYVQYVIWQGRNSNAKWKDPMVLEDIGQALDSEGNVAYNLILKSANGLHEFIVTTEEYNTNTSLKAIMDVIEQGDSVRFKIDNLNNVKAGQILFFNDGVVARDGVTAIVSKNQGIQNGADRQQYSRIMYGKVVGRFGKFVELEYLNAGGALVTEYCKLPDSIVKYDYNGGREFVETAVSSSNVEIGSKLAVFIVNRSTKLVVMYVNPNL